MEAIFFLIDIALITLASLSLSVSLVLFGGAGRNARAVVAVACYMVVAGLALSAVPLLLWPVARQDNAFIGNIMLSLVAVVVGSVLLIAGLLRTSRGQRAHGVARGALLGIAGAAIFTGLLLLRGPGAWRSGSGQFGVDVILVGLAVGAILFALTRRRALPVDTGPAAGVA